MRKIATLVELLEDRSLRFPDRIAYRFLADGTLAESTLTFSELAVRARRIGANLRAQAAYGERALLLYPPGLEYITAFFGCLYGGVIAVPAYPPNPNRLHRSAPRLHAMVGDGGIRLALTHAGIMSKVAGGIADDAVLRRLKWFSTDDLLREDTPWTYPAINDQTLAFLQYTSGSTATPKGVMVSHGNLLHNEFLIATGFGNGPDDRVAGWLPLYHDMGLIGNVLQPLYLGIDCVMTSPIQFLRRPFSWLKMISDYGATISGGPNFAYALCVDRITQEQKASLDLSGWKVAFNGAEPIRAETLAAFSAAFADAGFRKRSFYTCYGMAETTLMVTGGKRDADPKVTTFDGRRLDQNEAIAVPSDHADARAAVGSGTPIVDLDVRIVDPNSRQACSAGQVGEIWVAGPSVAQGYYNRPEETQAAFAATIQGGEGPFLRTGDLGFFHDNELFISGRLKDLIIIRGRNLYPQDIEQTASQAYPGLRPDCAAAFTVPGDDGEALVVVQEGNSGPSFQATEAMTAIRQAVAEQHEVQVAKVVLIKPRTIPKTSSGKIQRSACRKAFLNDTLKVTAAGALPATQNATNVAAPSPAFILDCLEQIEHGPSRQTLLTVFVRHRVAEIAGIGAAAVDADTPLTATGLDSLAAVQLQHDLETKLNVVLPMAALLEGPTPREAATQLAALLEAPGTSLTGLTQSGNPLGRHPLSYAQRSMWFLNRLNPTSAAYNISHVMRIDGPLKPTVLQQVVDRWCAHHGALRTTFHEGEGAPYLLVHEHGSCTIDVQQAGSLTPAAILTDLAQTAAIPFDLAQGPLLRLKLVRRSADEHYLLIALHHIIGDMWSMGLLFRDLRNAYSALAAGDEAPSMATAPAYTHFTAWQETLPAGAAGEQMWTFWRTQLDGPLPVLDLPFDRSRGREVAEAGGAVVFQIDQRRAEAVGALAKSQGATPFMVLLSAYFVLLHRYAGQDDLIVGSPTAGRNRAVLTDVVGYFVNPVAIRANLGGNPSFLNFLDRIRETTLAAFKHQDYPFPLLVENLGIQRDSNVTPVFQTMFTLQGLGNGRSSDATLAGLDSGATAVPMADVCLTPQALPEFATAFDLTLQATPTEQGYTFCLQYRKALFDHQTVVRMAACFDHLLAALLREPHTRLARLPMMDAARRGDVLAQSKAATTAVPFQPAYRQIETWAETCPDAPALVWDGTQLSYGDLNQRAEALAMHLSATGAGDLIAVCCGRTADQVLGLLAVAKTGAAYLPIDPQYPPARIAYMLADAGVTCVLTNERCREVVPPGNHEVVLIDATKPAGTVTGRALAEPQPDMAAYVIYTSGSTGRPKGVVVTHRGLANLTAWHHRAYAVTAASRAMLTAGPAFDASAWETWPNLAAGACLAIPDDETLTTPAKLTAFMATQAITHTFLATPLAEALLAWPTPPDWRLTHLLTGGDRLRVGKPAQAGFQLFNNYGPTECTVVATMTEINSQDSAAGVLPIGGPIDNLQVYLLDADMEPVVPGVIGELFLGGAGLAQGYLGKPALTAAAFVPDPFATEPGARLYRTGDLGRRLADGRIAFLGRRDNQVQIRGFRIEPGEIEGVLGEHEGVAGCIVRISTDDRGLSHVTAYIKAKETLSAQELQAFAANRLPEYMTPRHFVFLEAIPLTANGKVDYKALPQPAYAPDGYRAPVTETEHKLSAIWAEVLQVEAPGLDDNFFDLGGHSLLATQLLVRINAAFNSQLPLRALFTAATIGELAPLLADNKQQGTALPPITAGKRPERLPLSPAQTRLWFLQALDPQSAGYNIPVAAMLEGRLDRDRFQAAIRQIVARHEILRANIHREDGNPYLIIHPEAVPTFSYEEAGGVDAAAHAPAAATEEAETPFDLARDALVRVRLIQYTQTRHLLLLTFHHLVADGWSLGVFLRELGTFYQGETAPAALPFQYPDVAVWQKQHMTAAFLAEQADYWKQQLADHPAALELPSDRPRRGVGQGRSDRLEQRIDQTLTEALTTLGRSNDATLFMTLTAAFQVLLARYSGQTDILLGTPDANRHLPGCEGLIGFFVNTLVLRGDLSANPTFNQFVGQIRETATAAYQHRDLPFDKMVEVVNPDRSLTRSTLFQVMFAMNSNLLPETVLPGVVISPLAEAPRPLQNELVVTATRDHEGCALLFEYDADLFDRDRMQRMADHFVTLLQGAVARPDTAVFALPLLQATERARLLTQWNESGPLPVFTEPCHALFSRTAQRRGDHAALTRFPDTTLSYAALDRLSDAVAGGLHAAGVGAETVVAVSLPRTAETVALCLGVLKSGAVYLPLDHDLPTARLTAVLADAGAALLISEQQNAPASRVLAPATLLNAAPLQAPVPIAANQAAYIIYTSGSTGKPKGVVVEHGAMTAHMTTMAATYNINENDHILQFNSHHVDPWFEQVFPGLITGARIVQRDATIWTGEAFARLIDDEQLSIADLPTAYGREILETWHEQAETRPRTNHLRLLIFGGEAFKPRLLELWRSIGLSATCINAYGPTEATITATTQVMDATISPAHIPIGRPLTGRRAMITDAAGEPVPVGVVGELLLGGAGLARGYGNRPALTAAAFRPDPFSTTPGTRLYHTGDLAYWDADGRVVTIGRADAQIKRRGFRVELGEIEAVLSSHPAVTESVAVAVGRENPRIAAYWTGAGAEAPDEETLTRWLAGLLPTAMMPDALIRVAAFTHNSQGKIERRGLPIPRWETAEDHSTPLGDTEEGLHVIWCALLERERLGVESNFFSLGGHSLLATRLMSRIRARFSVALPLGSVFEAPTIRQLASLIDQAGARPRQTPIPIRKEKAEVPLSFAQQRLWFYEQFQPGTGAYNVFAAIQLSGYLNHDALTRAFNQMVTRHEVLRTVFNSNDGKPIQLIQPDQPLAVTRQQVADRTAAEKARHEEARRPFDLTTGPLTRLTLLTWADDEAMLLITQHHIISDGWSVNLMIRELTMSYAAEVQGESAILPELPIQYADFAVWQRDTAATGGFNAALDYWADQLAGMPQSLDLLSDHPRGEQAAGYGRRQSVCIDKTLVAALEQQQDVTPFMIFLAVYQLLLWRWAGADDFGIGIPVANRNRAETENLLGFFVNTLVIRADLSNNPDFAGLLERVRRACLAAYQYQDAPFDKVVEILKPDRSQRNPLFQTMFVFQNDALPSLSLPELKLNLLTPEDVPIQFETSLEIVPEGDHYRVAMEYDAALFDDERISGMLAQFETVLKTVAAHTETPIGQISLVSSPSAAAVLRGPSVGYPRRPIHSVIANQAAADPDAIAVCGIDGEGALSRTALETWANGCAAEFMARGVQPGVTVGVFMKRTPQMVAVMLGILKAGGVYVPLDPTYPADRLTYMVEDARIPFVVADEGIDLPSGFDSAEIVRPPGRPNEAASVDVPVDPEQPAYVIYTSGSSGQPKGVVVPHRALVHYTYAGAHGYGWQPGDVMLQFASLNFDSSIEELFLPLTQNGRLVLRSDEMLATPATFMKTCAAAGITLLSLPTAYWHEITAALVAGDLSLPACLRLVVIGGEAALLSKVQDWRSHANGVPLFNTYGPTETTVVVTVADCSTTPPRAEARVSIGQPIANTCAMVVDEAGSLLPRDVPGELCIAGDGMSLGYLGKAALTAKVFVPNPLGAQADTTAYRTGDRVRLTHAGEIEYLGRIDDQVKINGFRIELGEIETSLCRLDGVREAAVLPRAVRSGGEQRLIAYLVQSAGADWGVRALRDAMREALPAFMVPAYFIALDALPRTLNGKLDKQALPLPSNARDGLETDYVAPRHVGEEVVAALWSKLLGVEKIGVHDNFFELGGHSLLATQLVAHLQKTFRIGIPLAALFEKATIAQTVEALIAREPAPGQFMKSAALRKKIDQMTPEQRQALLAKRRGTP